MWIRWIRIRSTAVHHGTLYLVHAWPGGVEPGSAVLALGHCDVRPEVAE
jgi:hypothetical protein